MSDDLTPVQSSRNTDSDRVLAVVNYILLLLSPVGMAIALILAYMRRERAEVWVQSHFTYQIMTVWYALFLGVVGFITTFILIGFLILALLGVWILLRVAIGLVRLVDGRPHPDPKTFLF